MSDFLGKGAVVNTLTGQTDTKKVDRPRNYHKEVHHGHQWDPAHLAGFILQVDLIQRLVTRSLDATFHYLIVDFLQIVRQA